jgi:hypothetical protein
LVTDKQVRRLFALVKVEGSLETAAAKAGMDAKTARKYRWLERVPSELTPGPRWRTREDPFQEVWEEVQNLLEVNHGLEAKTIFEHLQPRIFPPKLKSAFRSLTTPISTLAGMWPAITTYRLFGSPSWLAMSAGPAA